MSVRSTLATAALLAGALVSDIAGSAQAAVGLDLHVVRPAEGESVAAGGVLKVSGSASDRGYPEPIMIDSVTVSIDGGPEIPAELRPGLPTTRTVFLFELRTPAPAVVGAHRVRVTATNDQLRTLSKSVQFFVVNQ
ncbi:hypothetical protein FKR81_12870 [Lentzea tibetensis]|uniref:Uncharacterized protein n=1 Tax=Lentzea tibetensis TaxID=2591470 RepID=A0A563EW01_9PSEU|nr:hypothetical protein [Lentzea tibetensis]TWP51752.1 hypothetical protein FKR81_12870 [Lentzea tibetensis]